MLRDRFGNEIRVGDRVLYPQASGRSSGAIHQYTVVSIRETGKTKSVWDEYTHNYNDVPEYAVMVQSDPHTYTRTWGEDSGEEVTVTYRPVRIRNEEELILMTGINFINPERQENR